MQGLQEARPRADMENSLIMRLKPVHALIMLLLFSAMICYPALGGLFLLDDMQNLRELAEVEARGYAYYLFASNAGPGGRPLSLLTFALQYQSWPGDPFAFKLVNLLLHLGNGALIFYICRLTFPFLRLDKSSTTVIALLVTGLWLLHPLQLSTVFYIVQRMTILATSFMLLGTLLYLTGRQFFLQGKTRQGLLIALPGVYICTLLAILSKEIGILLPLYLLVMEFTLLADRVSDSRWRQYCVPILLLPLLIFGAYLVWAFPGLQAAYQIRDFTMGQRLLTQANVLIDYLWKIAIPVAGSYSVFHDDYPLATGLFSPPATIINLSIIILSIAAALIFRNRVRVFSFAVLWFFAGHVLESSFIGLELYFEHRNYLPLFGICILIVWGLIKLSEQIQLQWLRLSIVPACLLVVFAVTWMEVNLWSQPWLQAHQWARHQPESKRALDNLVNISLILNDNAEARDALEKLAALDNQDIYPVLKEITIRSCYDRESLTAADWRQYNQSAATAQFRGLGVVTELGGLLYRYNQGNCAMLDVNSLEKLIGTLSQNSSFNPVLGHLYEMAATVAVIQGKLDLALSNLDRSISMYPVIDSKIFKLRILIAKGDWIAAFPLLDEIKGQLQTMPRQYLVYRNIINELELQLPLSVSER